MTNRIRGTSAALLFLVCVVTLTSAFNLPNRSPDLSSRLASLRMAVKPTQQHTMLTLADRVAYQRAIEEVYWRHRIWPKERPDPKPSLDQVMPPGQLEKKVEDYLRNSEALEDYWQQPLSAEQLQAEMERMAQHTKQPEVLREIFEALGNDPFVIAECLARPAVSERLLTNFYSHDQRFHGELKQRAEADLRAHHSVKQMKQTSGKYSEIELVRSDSGQDEENRGAEPGLKMDSREWDENVQKLTAMFGGVTTTQIKTGVLSPLQEDEGRYYATAVLKNTKDRLKLATVEWRKEPLESWRVRAENQLPKVMAAVTANYALPTISEEANVCTNNTWTATASAPDGREAHTAVWTGSEMIVWGGQGFGYSSYFNTGGRYNPSTDSWTATSTTNAPSARSNHTAVWTGSEMIIWGGYGTSGLANTGGRYNPSTDSWTATRTTNAPSARELQTAVWTGSEMIIWGGTGISGYFNTGGRYNPSMDTWIAISTANAPSGRTQHTAVWTDSEMIIWGGYDGSSYSNTGGRYNPGTDSWTATAIVNAPLGRSDHTVVWTGSEMVVWGGARYPGGPLNTGGRYNPGTNSWTATSTANTPSARNQHTAVWTGSEMIIWGGGNDLNTGARYDPTTDSWTATSTTNAPAGRELQTAVWTGREMIIWGGSSSAGGDLNTGGRYNPNTDSWIATNPPSARTYHTAIWTGNEMIIWGGADVSDSYVNTGGRYNPATDSWTATSTTNAPTGRALHTAIWTGSEMIVWGGVDYPNFLHTGGRYNPGTDSWTATSTANAPAGRQLHTAVWSGSEMIVWGGYFFDGSPPYQYHYLNTGGRYNPSTNSWTATSTTNAPSARFDHTAVWTGGEMIIWGGGYLNTGGRYNPSTNSWTATSTTNAPSARAYHTAVWTGNQMIVWGGANMSNSYLNTGGRYNPSTNSWSDTSTTNASSGRDYHTAIWTGSQMIVWGGTPDGSTYLNTGGRYSPSTNSWSATSTTNAPSDRYLHTAVWTGSEMIVWGGQNMEGGLSTGGRYCAQSNSMGPPIVTTNPPTYVASFSATLNGSLNPHELTTTVHFQYGPTTSYGFTTPVQTQTGNTSRSISASISGLIASHIYHFRIVAHNSAGTSYGSDRSFTTLSATGPPVVTTATATTVASFSATLNGSVDPHGLTTTVHFQYGTTTSYGSTTPRQSQTGSTFRNISANIGGLSANTVYHFRIVAANSDGTRYGSDSTFTTLSATGPPVVTTSAATNVASFSATLNGSLDPHGLTTTVHFQYGTTISYGLTTAVQSQTGSTFRNVSANISGLSARTIYHFRIVATNSDGTRYGSDRTFTTP